MANGHIVQKGTEKVYWKASGVTRVNDNSHAVGCPA